MTLNRDTASFGENQKVMMELYCTGVPGNVDGVICHFENA